MSDDVSNIDRRLVGYGSNFSEHTCAGGYNHALDSEEMLALVLYFGNLGGGRNKIAEPLDQLVQIIRCCHADLACVVNSSLDHSR